MTVRIRWPRPYALLSWSVFAAFLLSVRSAALGPHEVVVLINENSLESKQVANEFIHLRRVPPENVVYVSLPDSVLEPAAEISHSDFSRLIWEPVNRTIRQRGIENHILAWVYSVGFPVRIAGYPGVSIQGLTFLRNRMPNADVVKTGSYRSPFFAGPDGSDAQPNPSVSLDHFAGTSAVVPLPSMMLGFTGARGNEVQKVLSCLRQGIAADHLFPDGDIFFLVSSDVRSQCRAWQYPEAQKELASLGVRSSIVTQIPAQARIAGLMMGSASVPHTTFAGPATYVPGAMCEHLTSAAAVFDDPNQTKLTHWIESGATASAGTVSEPYAQWAKFPSARFYAHLARGCTILESFFLSIRCPLQVLLVGEPLGHPWAPDTQVSLVAEPASGAETVLHAAATARGLKADFRYAFFLDGRSLENIGRVPTIRLNTAEMADGYHHLRVVAVAEGPTCFQGFAETSLLVFTHGRAVSLSGITQGEIVDLNRPRTLEVNAGGNPLKTCLIHNERRLGETKPGHRVSLDPMHLGAGPHRIWPAAVYADGELVRGCPVDFVVADVSKPPVIRDVSVERRERDVRITVLASDPNAYDVRTDWFQPIDLSSGHSTIDLTGGRIEETDSGVLFTPEHAHDACVVTPGRAAPVSEFLVDVSLSPRKWSPLQSQIAGVVFDYKDARNFSFFALMGKPSAWVIGQCRKGELEARASRGRFIRPDRWHTLAVRETGHGVAGIVNDEKVVLWEGGRMSSGLVGLLAGGSPAHFRNARIAPPCQKGFLFTKGTSHLTIAPAVGGPRELIVRVRNERHSTFRIVDIEELRSGSR